MGWTSLGVPGWPFIRIYELVSDGIAQELPYFVAVQRHSVVPDLGVDLATGPYGRSQERSCVDAHHQRVRECKARDRRQYRFSFSSVVYRLTFALYPQNRSQSQCSRAESAYALVNVGGEGYGHDSGTCYKHSYHGFRDQAHTS